jgi:hypothetical protein
MTSFSLASNKNSILLMNETLIVRESLRIAWQVQNRGAGDQSSAAFQTNFFPQLLESRPRRKLDNAVLCVYMLFPGLLVRSSSKKNHNDDDDDDMAR